MESHLIMQASMLDVLFENRNKEYGAYVLRKSYNERLTKAMLSMLAMVIIISIFMRLAQKPQSIIQAPTRVIDADHTLSKPPSPDVVAQQRQVNHHTSMTSFPPVIVETDFIKKPIAELPIVSTTAAGPVIGSSTAPVSNGGHAQSITVDSSAKLGVTQPVKVDRTIVVDHPDISPQYPGGLKELLRFLKANLHSPDELIDQEISVKVKFVVNYDGSLLRFDVVQSGGESFDNEVLRVLRKMPKWVPGKSNGDNVAVWYAVPVKFLIPE